MIVDYVGLTIDLMKWQNGEVVTCQPFVAVLGAFSYTYAKPSHSHCRTGAARTNARSSSSAVSIFYTLQEACIINEQQRRHHLTLRPQSALN